MLWAENTVSAASYAYVLLKSVASLLRLQVFAFSWVNVLANICPLLSRINLDLLSVIKQQKQAVGGSLFAIHASFHACVHMHAWLCRREFERRKQRKWQLGVGECWRKADDSLSQHQKRWRLLAPLDGSASHVYAKSDGETVFNCF